MEIIWDDARFASSSPDDEFCTRLYDETGEQIVPNGCPGWFARACKENLFNLSSRKRGDADRPDHLARQR